MIKSYFADRRHRYPIYAFLASLLGILFIFALAGIPPFGAHSLLSMDAWSQYFPMLMEGGDSLLSQWSFSGALGFNSLAQSAYYTMSPLWYLVYIFPLPAAYIALHLVIALRFALAGFTFYLFISHRYRATASGIAFSLAYSLSAYGIAFLNQFMWMDAVVLLPLVALGLERLVNKKPLLYLLSLALTLYSCFYIGYMVCIFSVLYFLILLFRKRRPLRERAAHLARFSVTSLLAGGLSAAVLLPTYLALSETIASGLGFEGEMKLTHAFSVIIKQFFPFGEISLEFGAPNLYCGSLCLFFFLISLLLPGRTLRARILTLSLALLIYFSCTLNLFDFVWHGMHYPNQLPGRQSFIFIFFVVSEAYAAFLLITEPGRLARTASRIFAVGVPLFLAIEILLNGALMVVTQTWTCQLSSYAYWDDSMEKVASSYSEGPFRSEKISCFNFNAGQLYRYNGISYYSSTMSKEAYGFFGKIGMGVYAQNVSTLYQPSNILNMLFSVRYLHAYNGDTPEGLYIDEVEALERVTVYENRYCLPLAFTASRDALTLDTENLSAHNLQNAMLASLLGDRVGSRYTSEEALSDAYRRLTPGGMEILSFRDSRIKGRVTAQEDALLFTSIPADKGWRVYVDGERVETVTVFDYLLGVEISEGEHTVELVYTAPGFWVGLVLSSVSAAAVVTYIVFTVRRKGRYPHKSPAHRVWILGVCLLFAISCGIIAVR